MDRDPVWLIAIPSKAAPSRLPPCMGVAKSPQLHIPLQTIDGVVYADGKMLLPSSTSLSVSGGKVEPIAARRARISEPEWPGPECTA